MLYMTKEKFEEICEKYPTLLVIDGDVSDALNFVQDLLEAEANALKERELHAVKTIERLNQAAHEVFDICNDIEGEAFLEEDSRENDKNTGVAFQAGHYEWCILKDGEVVYALEVDSENFDGMDIGDLVDYVGECLDAIQKELREDEKPIFSDEELRKLRALMVDAWAMPFGIDAAVVGLPECVTIPISELELDEEEQEIVAGSLDEMISDAEGQKRDVEIEQASPDLGER